MNTIDIHSERETAKFAEVLAHNICGGMVLGLSGDLGAGKTTFVRYLLGALGGRPSDVASPSFTLQNQYSIPEGMDIEHWDLYRVREMPEELLEPPAKNSVRIVEWPEQCPDLLPEIDLMLSFEVLEAGERRIIFSGREGARMFSIVGGKKLKVYGD